MPSTRDRLIPVIPEGWQLRLSGAGNRWFASVSQTGGLGHGMAWGQTPAAVIGEALQNAGLIEVG